MIKLFLLFSIFILNAACSEEETVKTEKCNTVIVDSNQFDNSQSDAFELVNLNFESGCLKIQIRFGGGCQEVSTTLIDSEDVYESNPAQRNLKIVLFTNYDECEALIEKSFYFDLRNLQIENERKVLLNFQGSDLTYLYEY